MKIRQQAPKPPPPQIRRPRRPQRGTQTANAGAEDAPDENLESNLQRDVELAVLDKVRQYEIREDKNSDSRDDGQQGKGEETKGAKQKGPKRKDGFEVKTKTASELTATAQIQRDNLERTREAGPNVQLFEKPKPPSSDAISALKNSQEPGVFWRERIPGKDEIPELLLAVEELKALLKDVPGVEKITAGADEASAPIVVVAVCKGLTNRGLQTIPSITRGFPVVVAMPFDMLPKKRLRLG